MKAFFATIFKRGSSTMIKFMGVKGTLSIGSGILFAINPSEYTLIAYLVFSGLLIIGREYDKYLELIKTIKGIK